MRVLARRWASYFGLSDPPPQDAPFARGDTPVGGVLRVAPPLLGALAIAEAVGLDRSAEGVLGRLGLVVALTVLWVFTFNAALGYFLERKTRR